MLFFPDRQPRLGLIDDIAAGVESITPMFGRDTHPHGHITQMQMANAVHTHRTNQPKSSPCLRQDSLSFRFTQRHIALVLE